MENRIFPSIKTIDKSKIPKILKKTIGIDRGVDGGTYVSIIGIDSNKNFYVLDFFKAVGRDLKMVVRDYRRFSKSIKEMTKEFKKNQDEIKTCVEKIRLTTTLGIWGSINKAYSEFSKERDERINKR